MTATSLAHDIYTIDLAVQPHTRRQTLSVVVAVEHMTSWGCRLEEESTGGSAVAVLRDADGTLQIQLYRSNQDAEPEIKLTIGDQTATMLVRALDIVWARVLGPETSP